MWVKNIQLNATAVIFIGTSGEIKKSGAVETIAKLHILSVALAVISGKFLQTILVRSQYPTV